MESKIWHTISLDFGSMAPSGEYLLNFKDENTRRLIIKYTRRLTSYAAIRACKEVFREEGVPSIVKTDNGPAFRSREWAEYAREAKFKHRKITPLHPAANGGIERTMRLNNKIIRIANTTKQNWKMLMSKALERYNQTPHSATKFAPNTLANKPNYINILPQIRGEVNSKIAMDKALANDRSYKAKMKIFTDKYRRAKAHKFSVNDPVLHKWERPNKFTPIFDPVPYLITNIKNSMITARNENRTLTRNASHFKPISRKCYEQATSRPRDKPVQKVTFANANIIDEDRTEYPMTPISPQITSGEASLSDTLQQQVVQSDSIQESEQETSRRSTRSTNNIISYTKFFKRKA